MQTTISTVGPISWTRRLMPAAAAWALGSLLVFSFARTAAAQDAAAAGPPLTFGNNFFVTGDYAIGGTGLGKSASGFASGTISIGNGKDTNPGVVGTNTVPQGAQIVHALLYWQTVEIVGGATGQNGFFRPVFNGGPSTGYPITGAILMNPSGTVYWTGTGCASASPTPKQLVTYRADVRALLRQDAQGNVVGNGDYQVTLASQSNGTPLTLGATLVLVYRVLSPTFPLNAVVIYNGTPASSSTMTQKMVGFYDAATIAADFPMGGNPVSKLTYIAGNGRKNLSERVFLNTASNPNNQLPDLYQNLGLPPFPNWYGTVTGNGSWDNPTWILGPGHLASPLTEDDSTATTVVQGAQQGCVTPAAIIYSTTVKNTDQDGILDAWKVPAAPYSSTPGYCDVAVNPGTCNGPTDPSWVDLTGALKGQKDVFVQLDYMCSKPIGPNSCDTLSTVTDSLSAASAASGGTTTYTGTFSPPIAANIVVTITGFANAANNGQFAVVGSSGTQLVVNNASGVAESHLGSATFTNYSFDPQQPVDPADGKSAVKKVVDAFAGTGTNTNHVPVTVHVIPTHAILEPTCKDDPNLGLCAYPNQPGEVGWKGGLVFLKNQIVDSATGRLDLCTSANPPATCVPVFQHGRKDSYHYALFAHAVGLPNWSLQGGTLTSVVQTGFTVTFTTSTPHGLGPNVNDTSCVGQSQGRVTVAFATTNPNLNGTQCANITGLTTFTIQVANSTSGPVPYTPSTDPNLAVASGQADAVSGFSDIGGQDTLVTLGSWKPSNVTPNVKAGTFMHELGHTLGLTHGGFYYDTAGSYIPTVEANCKTNFQSVMSYMYQVDLLDNGGATNVPDYSGLDLVKVDKSVMKFDPFGVLPYQTSWHGIQQQLVDELGPHVVDNASQMKFRCDGSSLTAGAAPVYRVTRASNFLFWEMNQDINFDDPSVTETAFRGHNDWAPTFDMNGTPIAIGVDPRQVGMTGSLSALTGGGIQGGSGGIQGGSGGIQGGSGGIQGGSGGIQGGSGGIQGGSGGIQGGSGGVPELTQAVANSFTRSPRNLKASEEVSARLIDLSWAAPSFGDIGAYRIYRSDDDGTNFSLIATVPGNQLTFQDTVSCKPTGYRYYVTAVLAGTFANFPPPAGQGQESAPSNIVTAGSDGHLTGCYTLTGFSSPTSAVQGSIVPITWTLQDDFNTTNFPVNRLAANTSLVAIGPVSNDASCGSVTLGNTTLLSNGVPTTQNASTLVVSNGQFTFYWDTDVRPFCAGSYTFKLTLDSTQSQTTATPLQLSIDVNDTDSTPHVATLALNAGTVGLVAYSTTLTEDGGTAPFKWTFTGSLPAGISQQSLNSPTLTGTTCAAGNYSFTAMVTDSKLNSGMQALTLQINKANTTTGVTSNANPSVFQQMVTFTVTVAPQYTCTPTGTVTLLDGGTPIASNLALNGGMATYTTSTLLVGIHQITASYGGDSNFNTSNSLTLSQTVNKANTTTAINLVSPSPAVVGQAISVAYTLAVVAPGAGTPIVPTGTVTVAASDASGCVVPVPGPGMCTLSPPPTTAGNMTFTVTFSGDGNFVGSVANGNYMVLIFASDSQPTPPPPFTATTALPNAVVGSPYNNTVYESGGVSNNMTPFSWTIVPGSVMPGNGSTLPGLSFQPNAVGVTNGTLSGTPTTAGTFTFTAMVTDSAGNTGTQTLTLPVQPACAAFPAGVVPFTTIFSIATDSAGDMFVLGGRPAGGLQAALQQVPLPNAVNQQFCSPVTLETNYTVPAYVPTAADRGGDFSSYAGLVLIDPTTNQPFAGNVIPPARLDTIFAWRIPKHSANLPRLSCSLEPTLQSIEGTVQTSIQFVNNTAGPVNIYWINYQGQRVFYRGGPFAALAAGQSYVQGTFITHPWIVTDVANNSCLGIWEPTESAGTAVITGSPSFVAPQAPTNLVAQAQAGPPVSVVLNWNASASNNVVGYNVYRATMAAGPFSKLTPMPTANLNFSDTTVSSGQTYYYFVTAVDANSLESAYSNEAPAMP
jgi:hypothetical protein